MTTVNVNIVAIGNEIISGKITDTNSRFLAGRLEALGFSVRRVSSVGDYQPEIQLELEQALSRAELVITTGGLGPTSDDLTRDAIAAVAGTPLVESAAAKAKLEELFVRRNRPLNPNNLRQIVFPDRAEVLANPIGTADAFITTVERHGTQIPIVALPGVPRELFAIYEQLLIPWMQKRFPSGRSIPASIAFRCFGLSESYIGQQIEACGLPPEMEVAYRPMFPEILITIRLRGEDPVEARMKKLEAEAARVTKSIGEEFVISRDEHSSHAVALGTLLQERGLTIAAAESCSGGLLADMLVSTPGASAYLSSSVVAYSNDAKSVYLGVRPAILDRYGAVSAETAVEMARGARLRTGSDYGVSITGVAGPDGGSKEKPVGTFFIGLASPKGEQALRFFYPHERNMIRLYSATLALDLVRREILNLPLEWERK